MLQFLKPGNLAPFRVLAEHGFWKLQSSTWKGFFRTLHKFYFCNSAITFAELTDNICKQQRKAAVLELRIQNLLRNTVDQNRDNKEAHTTCWICRNILWDQCPIWKNKLQIICCLYQQWNRLYMTRVVKSTTSKGREEWKGSKTATDRTKRKKSNSCVERERKVLEKKLSTTPQIEDKRITSSRRRSLYDRLEFLFHKFTRRITTD